MHIPYYSVTTVSGAKVETYLPSIHARGYLRISKPISLGELLASDKLSALTIECRSLGLEVKSSEYERIKSKVFVEGTGAWAVGAQELICGHESGKLCTAYLNVEADGRGGVYVTAYADVARDGYPTQRVQLDVEFD